MVEASAFSQSAAIRGAIDRHCRACPAQQPVPATDFALPATSDFSTQAPSSTERMCSGTKKSGWQLGRRQPAVQTPSPVLCLRARGKQVPLQPCFSSLADWCAAFTQSWHSEKNTHMQKVGWHLLGRVAPGWVLQGVGTSPTRLEMQLVRAGGLSQACVCPHVCRAAVQSAGLFPAEPLTLAPTVAVYAALALGVWGLQCNDGLWRLGESGFLLYESAGRGQMRKTW